MSICRLLFVAIVTLATSGAVPQYVEVDAANVNVIKQLEHDWETALKNNDQTTIDRIVAEDCMFVSSTGDVTRKAQADTMRRAYTTLVASTITEMNVRIFGDTAVVIGTNVETSQYRGQDTTGQYRWTDVFVRRSGRWQAVSAQSTRIG
jgi:ketosteroid isomerase-like protein